MIRLGLTGSIGMGKSTVAAMFAQQGVPVFDADAQVHALQAPGGAAVAAIEREFPGTTGAMGVDRAALGNAVFGDDDAMKRLEAIIHPAIARAREAFANRHADATLLLFDVPLLFETGGSYVDKVAVVSAPAEVQRERVLARPDMNEARFEAIMARQMPDAEKRARADFVIDTGTSLDATQGQVRRLIACLSAAGAR
ncbi:dephospho-CoA kinase [Stakelama sp. CBK3Z-3]|uniref:Dephospho-CoA kinase n=1 Tax=Stakelama flava TaxID=2860338 RepID=A0ABS6XKJ5_9SPHN|nr:dephospho-CoA kinase [Stakelama flava]MBW4330728.1 dephospho-CoA kinase [Stakelama flava]